MSRWRIAVVLTLIGLPVAIWAGLGTYYLWITGWAFWAWWPMLGLMALGYFLAAYWQRQQQLLRPPDFEVPLHWTDRDRTAWKLVEARATRAASLPAKKLTEPTFYQQSAQEMALELATFYHPGVKDPLDGLTVPEILAVVELAAHDMWELVEKHLPGGHLLTVRDWKRGRELVQWYQTGSNVYWAISAVFNPLQTGMRYLASQAGIAQPIKILQQNLYLWFYTAFLHRLGHYLIDVNSGRLRVGAARYRELLEQLQRQADQPTVAEKLATGPNREDSEPSVEIGWVTVTLLGQVKAAKSSLINALLGEQRARTGVVPMTDGIERYELLAPGVPDRLILQDTVGYSQAGPNADQVNRTGEAAKQSDLLLLVLHAKNPGRQADLTMLEKLRAWFAARPDLKAPPIIAVLTHIDLLSPSLEWAPPYNWLSGQRPKEVSVREALAVTRQQLGEQIVSIVPVCTQSGQVYGVDEALLPAMTNWLDESRAVALLRAIKAEADRDQAYRIFQQVLASGKVAVEQLGQLLRGTPQAGS